MAGGGLQGRGGDLTLSVGKQNCVRVVEFE